MKLPVDLSSLAMKLFHDYQTSVWLRLAITISTHTHTYTQAKEWAGLLNVAGLDVTIPSSEKYRGINPRASLKQPSQGRKSMLLLLLLLLITIIIPVNGLL